MVYTEIMYQTIHERIKVIGIYQQAGFKPVKFCWQNQIYHIDQVNLISNIKQGQVKQRIYSVQVKDQIFRLLFDRAEETWTLKELWLEG